ncbi:MAG: hypothetical protein R3F43_00035 [bacterium]
MLVVLAGCGGAGPGPATAVDAARVDAPASDGGCEGFVPVAMPPAAPPFEGTAFLDPGIITAADPTSFVDLTYAGQAPREMFDRRTGAFGTVKARTYFGALRQQQDGGVQVNPEFTQAEAEAQARAYATVVGRLPAFAFRDLDTLWIHKGTSRSAAATATCSSTPSKATSTRRAGSSRRSSFTRARTRRSTAITPRRRGGSRRRPPTAASSPPYARDNPTREDVAETMVPYLAQRFRADGCRPRRWRPSAPPSPTACATSTAPA